MMKKYGLKAIMLVLLLIVSIVLYQAGAGEKFGRFINVMKDIATNVFQGSHEQKASISDEELAGIDIEQIARDLENKGGGLWQGEKAPSAPVGIPRDEIRDEELPTHTKLLLKEAKRIDLKDIPAKLKPLKKYLHEPFKMGACQVCHVPKGDNPTALVKKNVHEICYQCHKTKYTKAYDHKPVKDGNCLGCHDPHQSDIPKMLKEDSINNTCLKCHDKSNGAKGVTKFVTMDGKFKHKPAEKSCLECHDAHTSNYKSLMKKEVGLEFCLDCHSSIKDRRDMRKWINNVRYKHGAVENSKGKCLECHDPHSSNHPSILKKDPVQVCLGCHDKSVKADEDGGMLMNIAQHLKENPNWHKPIREPNGKDGGCNACHEPHGSDNFSILKKSFTKNFYANVENKDFFCFKCHKESKISEQYTTNDEITKFRDGDVNLHQLHVNDRKGRACRACHDEHASKYKHLIREYTDFNGIKFPLRFVDAPNGGSCAPACHKKFDYDRVNPKGIGLK